MSVQEPVLKISRSYRDAWGMPPLRYVYALEWREGGQEYFYTKVGRQKRIEAVCHDGVRCFTIEFVVNLLAKLPSYQGLVELVLQ